jgi:hypothetical protein
MWLVNNMHDQKSDGWQYKWSTIWHLTTLVVRLEYASKWKKAYLKFRVFTVHVENLISKWCPITISIKKCFCRDAENGNFREVDLQAEWPDEFAEKAQCMFCQK